MSACQPDTNTNDSGTRNEEETHKLVLIMDKLHLRVEPGLKGEIITKLTKGKTVEDLGEVSSFLTPVKMDSVLYCEPWMKVKTDDGQEGWIYAAGIDFNQLMDSLLAKRTLALLGKPLWDSVTVFADNFAKSESAQEVESLYQQGQRLQNALNLVLETASYNLSDVYGIPDLFWLKETVPGFVPQLVAEGTIYHLFIDYKQLLKKAKATEPDMDDKFFDICAKIYPDSIEYFYPAWSIQTWDYGGHSLLGRGLHRNILDRLELFSLETSIFEEQVVEFKQRIIDDITRADISYWESQDEILEEINGIIAAGYTILNTEDKVALEVRQKQFLQPGKFEIKLNLQAGE
jgi:hypothetical protein